MTENQAQHVRDDIAESLRFLQTDYLDLVLIHYPRPWTEKAKDDDSKNVTYRKEAYLELQKLSSEYSQDWKLWLKSAPRRALCARGDFMGTDRDETRLSQWPPRARNSAVRRVCLFWLSAQQLDSSFFLKVRH